jgi:hypothetical protein
MMVLKWAFQLGTTTVMLGSKLVDEKASLVDWLEFVMGVMLESL